MTKKEIINYMVENYGKGVETKYHVGWVVNKQEDVVLISRVSVKVIRDNHITSYNFNSLVETCLGILDKNDFRILF